MTAELHTVGSCRMQSKLHETMEEHLGQLAAEMQATRDQYKRKYLGKRKYDDEGEFKKVGIVVIAIWPTAANDGCVHYVVQLHVYTQLKGDAHNMFTQMYCHDYMLGLRT
jgi:hypothetical protein